MTIQYALLHVHYENLMNDKMARVIKICNSILHNKQIIYIRLKLISHYEHKI